MRMDVAAESSTFLLTQGVFGFTTLMLGLVVVFLYRENRAIRTQGDKEAADERAKHATEMAEVRKTLNEVQEARMNELRSSMSAVSKALATVDQAIAFIHGRTAV